MLNNISSFELNFLVRELSGIVVGARIDKVYHPEKNELLLSLYSTKTKKNMLRLLSPNIIYITSKKPESAKITQFCLFLRKKIQMGFINSIRQLGAERIVEIEISRPEETFFIVIELFSRGNILLLDQKKKILSATNYRNFKDRSIRAGITYELPPNPLPDVKNMTQDDFKKAFVDFDENIERFLAKKFAFGKIYAHEVMLAAGIDKDVKPDEKVITALYDTIRSMFEKELMPLVVKKEDETITEILPFKINKYEDQKNEPFDTFNKAIDQVYKDLIIQKKKTASSKLAAKKEKVNRIINAQKKSLDKIDKEAEELKDKGDQIYAHYMELKELLLKVNDLKKTKEWNDIALIIKKEKNVTDFNLKEKKIIVEL